MKRFSWLLLGFFVSIIARGETTVIEGVSTAIPDGEAISLFQTVGRVGSRIGCDTIRNGRFRFEVDADTISDKVSLMWFGKGALTSRQLCMQSGQTIKVYADNMIEKTWRVESTVPMQAEVDMFMLNSRDLLIEFHSDYLALNEVILNPNSTEEEKNIAKEAYGSRSAARDSIKNIINRRDLELMKTLPHSEVWLGKLSDMAYETTYANLPADYVAELKALYYTMTDEERQSADGESVKAYLFPPDKLSRGDLFRDADLYDTDGQLHHLSEFAGKWMVLNFWSSGCGASSESTVELRSLHETYPDKIAVISISQDVESVWKNATSRYDITWTNWNDLKETSGIFNDYSIRYLPTAVLVRPDGKVEEIYYFYSKGVLMREFRKIFAKETPTVVTVENGVTTVENPKFIEDKTGDALHIDRVEISDDSTTVYFTAYYPDGYWMSISPDSYLRTPGGERLVTTGADGITLGERFYPGDSGDFKFSMKYPPLPPSTETFDFIEGDDSPYQINGLQLK